MKINNIVIITILLLLVAGSARATVPVHGALDTILTTFESSANSWAATLKGYATTLFWILAAIDFAWMAILLALQLGEFTDFVAQTVRKILFLGFFLALLENGRTWAANIISSLVQAAGAANGAAGAGASMTPSGVFDSGYNICALVLHSTSLSSPIDSIALVIGAGVIMFIYALIAAQMLLVYVQSYIVLNAGVILLGFGGLTFTKDITLKYFQAAFSTGIKLFVMILMIGIGQQIISAWGQNFDGNSLEQICLMLAATGVLYVLIKEIPNIVGDLVNGFSWGAGESGNSAMRGSFNMAGAAATGAIAGAAGGIMAVSQASKLHKAQVSSGSSSSSWVGGVAKNLASAAKDDVAGRLTGNNRGFGTMGGRMASDMKKSSLESSSGMQDEPYFAAGPAKSQTKPQGNTNEQQNA